MAKDYKNTPRPSDRPERRKNPAKGGAPGWLWMVAGLSIGLFVALLVYLKDYAPKPAAQAPVAEKPPATSKKPKPETEQAQKPRFDFYNLLPEMEVLIPEQEIAAERDKQPSEHITYYLQAASFRKFEDADRMRAQLALANIESQIQRVTVNDTQTWHRVRVGPFHSAREMDKMRNRLRAENIDPIVLKVKS